VNLPVILTGSEKGEREYKNYDLCNLPDMKLKLINNKNKTKEKQKEGRTTTLIKIYPVNLPDVNVLL